MSDHQPSTRTLESARRRCRTPFSPRNRSVSEEGPTVQVVSLKLRNYLSVQTEDVSLGRLNVLIGTNASGKSNVMDALRFLHDAIRRDFQFAVASRGGFVHLACKASEAREVRLVTTFRNEDHAFEWSVALSRRDFDFTVREEVSLLREGQPPVQLLKRTPRTARAGGGRGARARECNSESAPKGAHWPPPLRTRRSLPAPWRITSEVGGSSTPIQERCAELPTEAIRPPWRVTVRTWPLASTP